MRTPAPLSHAERAKRRKKIAVRFKRLMAKGMCTADCYHLVCEEFRVTPATVKAACRENHVEIPRIHVRRKSAGKTLEVLAELIAGKRQIDIAAERNISQQRVSEIYAYAKKAGVFAAIDDLLTISRSPS